MFSSKHMRGWENSRKLDNSPNLCRPPLCLVVSFAAVIIVVTQRFSLGGEALRDDPNNGCEGVYVFG